MKKLSNKKMNKTFRDNLITYGMVIAAYVIMQILVSAGAVSSLLQAYWFLCVLMRFWRYL